MAIAAHPGGRRRTLSVLSVALAVYALGVAHFYFLTDDAFISFRYARNLAAGHGLTFNPGVDGPVEGYSNFLWVIVLAGVDLLGGDVTVWSRVLSFACGTVLIVLLVRTLSRLRLGGAAFLGAALWAAAMPPLTVWSTGGLATVPFTLLVFLVYLAFFESSKETRWLGGALAGLGAVLIRVDGLGWVLGLLFVAFACELRHPARRGAVLKAAGVVLAGFVALELWRHAYFGYWMPNTVHAKVGLSLAQVERGGNYLARFWAVFPIVPLLLGIALFRARSGAPGEAKMLIGAAAAVALNFAYVLAVGGDFMGMFRFLAPSVPFLAVLLAFAVEGLRRGARPILAGGLAALALLAAALPALGHEPVRLLARRAIGGEKASWSSRPQIDDVAGTREGCRRLSQLGRHLRAQTNTTDSILLRAIGAAGYYSERTVLDQYGLIDAELAHRPVDREAGAYFHIGGHDKYGNLAYFEARRPTYAYTALVSESAVSRPDPKLAWRLFEKHGDGAFMSVYRPVLIPLPEEEWNEAGPVYLLLAERDPAPDGGDNGWRDTLLIQENLRVPADAGVAVRGAP